MLTSENLRKAADLQDQVAALQEQINQLLNGASVDIAPATRVVHTASGRKFTPEAIEKIRAAQRRRWRKTKKEAAAAKAAVQETQVAPAAPAPAPAPAVVPAPVTAPAPAPAKRGQLVAA